MVEQIRQNVETFNQQLAQLRDQLAIRKPILVQFRHKLANPEWRLWLCFSGGTAVWALYFITVYALTSLACHWRWFGAPTDGIWVKGIQLFLTVLAAALITRAGYVAFHEWQLAREARNREADETKGARFPMLAFVTLLLNSFYLLIILLALVPIFVLAVCK